MLALNDAEAKRFAEAISTCLTTLDALPRDWQQRAIDMLNAAYPDVKQPPPSNWQLWQLDLQRYGVQITGTTTK